MYIKGDIFHWHSFGLDQMAFLTRKGLALCGVKTVRKLVQITNLCLNKMVYITNLQ